jgi:outer membrane receptor for ferrienterochelin and colicins
MLTLHATDITGYVRDIGPGNALEGASIYLKSAKTGTVSDKNGHFILEYPNDTEDTLIVDMIGYKSLKYPLRELKERTLVFLMETDILEYDKNIIVSATRRPININNTSVLLDVIEHEEIENSSAQNIAEILEQMPSLLIRDYGGVGNMKSISLRGTNAGHVLIMVDGQRINNPQNGEVDLALIPLDHVERIEVIRGGASAIYGSDAIGGVIQIITKENSNDKGFGLGIKQSFASFGTYAVQSDVSATIGRFGAMASYHYLSSEGDFSYSILGDDFIRANNDIKRHTVYTSINYSTSDASNALKIKLNYNYLNSEKGSPGTTSFLYNYARMFDRQHDLSFKLSKKSKDLKHTLSVRAYYSHDFNRYLNQHPTEVLFPSDDNYITEAVGSELQMTSAFHPQFVLNYGVSVRRDDFTNIGLDESYDRLSYAAFLVSENMFVIPTTFISKIKLTPSIRYNGNSEFKDNWTPKIGILLNVGPSGRLALKSNFAFNYRVPTFNDLYWPADAYTSGNPDLLPEYSRDWDLGVRYYNDRINMEVSYFNENLTNLIIWQPVNWVYTPQNVAESRIDGIESNMKIDVIKDIIQLNANYTYMIALDMTNGTDGASFLPNRAKHHANVSLSANVKGFDLMYSMQYVGKRYTDAGNTEAFALNAYFLNHVSLAYTLNMKMFKVQGLFEIRNLFNVSYSILSDLPMPGREFRFTLNTRLN